MSRERKPVDKPDAPLKLVEGDEPDGTLVAVYRMTWYRFLISGGRTLDVLAARDDAELRGAVLDYLDAEQGARVEGVARIVDDEAPDD